MSTHELTLRIFPSRLAVERYLLNQTSQGVRGVQHCVTFKTLFKQLRVFSSKRLLTTLEGRMLLRSLLHESDLVWKEMAHDPHHVFALYRSLMELRMAGITSKHFQHNLEGDLAQQWHVLLGAYEAWLHAHNVRDEADDVRDAVWRVATGQAHPFLEGVSRVHVEGCVQVLGASLDLLRAFAASGKEVLVRVPWDPARPEAFGWSEASLHALESLGHPNMQVETVDWRGEEPLSVLAGALWGESAPVQAPVKVHRFNRVVDEAWYVSGVVHRWYQQGVPLHAMAVLMSDPHTQGPMVRRFLRARGVPACMEQGLDLSESACGSLVKHVLDMPMYEYETQRMVELKGLMSDDVARVQTTHAYVYVGEVLRQAGVARIQPEVFAKKVAQWKAKQPENMWDETCDAWLNTVLEHVHVMESLKQDRTAHAYASDTKRVCELWLRGVQQETWDVCDQEVWPLQQVVWEHMALEKNAQEQLSELLGTFETSALWVETSTNPPLWSSVEWASYMRLALREHKQRSIDTRSMAVGLYAYEDVFETSYSHVVCMGASASLFPRNRSKDMFLTEGLRVQLNRMTGPKLWQESPASGRAPLSAQSQDLLTWMACAHACRTSWVVTYTSDTNDAHGPSPCVVELLRCLGREPESTDPTESGLWENASESVMSQYRAEVLLSREQGFAQTTDANSLKEIHKHMFERVHNVSHMDMLADCRLKYVLGVLLGCVVKPALSDIPQPRDEGDVWHQVLFHVYSGMVKKHPFKQWRTMPEQAYVYAREVFERVQPKTVHKTSVHPMLHKKMMKEAWHMLRLQLERDLKPSAHEPCFFEYPFHSETGLQGRVLEVCLNEGMHVRIKGTIDRMDQGGDSVAVWDYKRTVKKRSDDRQMQVPLYACVALRDTEHTHVQGGFLGLKDAKAKVIVSYDKDTLESMVQERMALHVMPVAKGHIAPNPDPVQTDVCTYCDVKHVCKIRNPVLEEDA